MLWKDGLMHVLKPQLHVGWACRPWIAQLQYVCGFFFLGGGCIKVRFSNNMILLAFFFYMWQYDLGRMLALDDLQTQMELKKQIRIN